MFLYEEQIKEKALEVKDLKRELVNSINRNFEDTRKVSAELKLKHVSVIAQKHAVVSKAKRDCAFTKKQLKQEKENGLLAKQGSTSEIRQFEKKAKAATRLAEERMRSIHALNILVDSLRTSLEEERDRANRLQVNMFDLSSKKDNIIRANGIMILSLETKIEELNNECSDAVEELNVSQELCVIFIERLI